MNFTQNNIWDSYSDLLITSPSGEIIDSFNLGGYRTYYERIYKIEGNDIYLIGYTKNDTCLSKIIISKFNLISHQLQQISDYSICDYFILGILVVKGLDNVNFLDVRYWDPDMAISEKDI